MSAGDCCSAGGGNDWVDVGMDAKVFVVTGAGCVRSFADVTESILLLVVGLILRRFRIRGSVSPLPPQLAASESADLCATV